jgi:FlaA1/EpsC-like NDP-sugar epimerase
MIVGNCGDVNLLETIFTENNVDILINASAYKHVSIMQNNPYAAFNNNVLNFINLLKVSTSFGVSNIIQVSTDKAAEPSNIMGFSKLLCEQILIHANKHLVTGFKYSIVRFGNVVGSSGSVVPIFIENIKNRNKLSVTHDEVERFMMQIGDAVSLILRAASHRKNETYILDMGEPYKILDLAVKMLNNSHFHHDKNLIEFTGLQDGEKLTEVLFTVLESTDITKQDGVFVIPDRDDSFLSEKELEMLFNGDVDFLYKKIDMIS